MQHQYHTKLNFISLLICLGFASCKQNFSSENFIAHFGGEVINPTADYVVLMKNNEVIDTLFLDENRRFFKTFDSLSPGMYTFKHEPEYQYVYFEKNDSLMVRINTYDFDESIVFCGRGDEKNNFLIELFLQCQQNSKESFEDYDLPVAGFLKNLDSSQNHLTKFYEEKKKTIQWSENFDQYVSNDLKLHAFTRKEVYPMMHQLRTGINNTDSLPIDYYDHRNAINFEQEEMIQYSPMVRYLSHMLSNISYQEVTKKLIPEQDKPLEMGLIKMKIADTLFKDVIVKNRVLDQIAFNFLLEDQNIHNTEKILGIYDQLSTNDKKKSEIKKIDAAIQKLNKGADLPNIHLISHDSLKVESNAILNKKYVISFWTENAETHLAAIHKKANQLSLKHPDYQFIFINIDTSHDDWRDHLKKYKNNKYQYYCAADFEELKSAWVIIKLHRTIILDENGKIENAFVNLFDARFSDFLKY